MLSPFERALVAHLVGDFLLQNDWMALHKTRLRHPAAWIHAGIHALLLTWALGWKAGVGLGIIHLLVDTGRPLDWWIRVFKKCEGSPQLPMIRLWTDQAIHVATIAAWLIWVP